MKRKIIQKCCLPKGNSNLNFKIFTLATALFGHPGHKNYSKMVEI